MHMPNPDLLKEVCFVYFPSNFFMLVIDLTYILIVFVYIEVKPREPVFKLPNLDPSTWYIDDLRNVVRQYVNPESELLTKCMHACLNNTFTDSSCCC